MASNILFKEVQDITECPICTDMFYNPKLLPCAHTFCLECIQGYGKDKREGEAMSCPMCRREFKVPTGGLSKLSTNFAIERLVTAQTGSDVSISAGCDVCMRAGKKRKVVASTFCMTCRENLCDECCKIHKSMVISMNHKLLPVDEVSEAMRKQLEAGFCQRHPTKELEFYCKVCKVPSCATCSITSHKSHETCEIGETAGKFKLDFLKYSDDVSRFMVNIERRSEWANKQIESFTRSIDQVEKDVIDRSQEIKRLVDRQAADLLRKLKFHKTSILKNIENDMCELRMNMMICDSFKIFCTKVVTEADSVEVVRVAEDLKTRAEEVTSLSLPEITELPQIKFVSFDIDIKTNQDNIVGKFSLQNDEDEYQLSSPRFREKLSTSGCVRGITSSNNGLYVVTSLSSDIDVYDIDTLAHRRKIRVEGLVNPWDIVAHMHVLYVSEFKEKLIHRVQLSDETSSRWSVNGQSLTLSVNKKGNIVVSCRDISKIIEYTPFGSCVREIQVNAIDGSIGGLQHAIQLDDDRFLICHATATTHHRVCKIDSSGSTMKSYGGEESGIGQMKYPCYLAINQNVFFLVVDKNNNRIIQLSASFVFIREFILGSVGLKRPLRMHLHEGKRRLYIAEDGERNITMFDL